MKVLQILVFFLLIFGLNFYVKAQVCGYTFITIYLSDSDGKHIKNAKFIFFDKEYDSPGLHQNNLMSWDEQRNAYFGKEGMCGGHRDVKLEVSAKGFDSVVKQIDLPLGWKSFSVKLKRSGTDEKESFEPLAHFRGQVVPEKGILFSETQIKLTDKYGKQFQTSTKNGLFAIDVPAGDYKIEFIQTKDFSPTIFEQKHLDENFNFVEVVLKPKMNEEKK